MPLPPMVVTHDGGNQFAIQIRGHRLVVDQPAGIGADAGPMPIELLGAALGSCVALYVQQFCEARDLSTEGLEVSVQQQGAKSPARVASFEVSVKLAAEMPPHYVELLERVARSCPAHHTLAHGAEVSVSVERATGVAD